MASVNKVIILGNVGKDPELRTFPDGGQVANVSIATTEKWKDKNTGELREATEWHRVIFGGRLAEVADQYIRKGSQIYVEGSIHTRKWTDQSGVEKYSTEIRARELALLGGRPRDDDGQRDGFDRAPAQAPQRQAPARRPDSGPAPAQRAAPPAPRPPTGSGFDDMDDDIPF